MVKRVCLQVRQSGVGVMRSPFTDNVASDKFVYYIKWDNKVNITLILLSMWNKIFCVKVLSSIPGCYCYCHLKPGTIWKLREALTR